MFLYQVDIIISEWMGYFLLYESMLDTVIYARDRYLTEGGLLLPDHCSLYLVALADSELRKNEFEFWDDVYGFRMSCMKAAVTVDPTVLVAKQEKVISDACKIKVCWLMFMFAISCCSTDCFVIRVWMLCYSGGSIRSVYDIEWL